MKNKMIAFIKRMIPNAMKNTGFFKIICKHKYASVATIAVLVCLSILLVTVAVATTNASVVASSDVAELSSESIEAVSSAFSVSSGEVSDSVSSETGSATASSKKSTGSKKASKAAAKNTTTAANHTANKGGYQYNTNLDIEDNVFMDALIYTGYNMKKHRADGRMWVYTLAKYKKGYGWLSNITYAGGSTGYETKNGKPDISHFEKNGLVCASFATYVYFNYLPNVAGIDTSSLPRPADSKLADSWYKAVQQWVQKGYSRTIDFTATRNASTNYITFSPKEEIPIGSIIVFRPYHSSKKVGSHVVVYAGYKNGFHWVYHVGTKNGPEMCAVERMLYGPEPQWPMMVVTAPSNIRMAATLEVELKDDSGKPISNVGFSLKSKETGKTITLGKTDKNGRMTTDCLSYGEYTLIQSSVPKGYTANTAETKIKLTTENNRKNTVQVINAKEKPTETSSTSSKEATSSQKADSSTAESTQNSSADSTSNQVSEK